jgi:hypothetical protein
MSLTVMDRPELVRTASLLARALAVRPFPPYFSFIQMYNLSPSCGSSVFSELNLIVRLPRPISLRGLFVKKAPPSHSEASFGTSIFPGASSGLTLIRKVRALSFDELFAIVSPFPRSLRADEPYYRGRGLSKDQQAGGTTARLRYTPRACRLRGSGCRRRRRSGSPQRCARCRPRSGAHRARAGSPRAGGCAWCRGSG